MGSPSPPSTISTRFLVISDTHNFQFEDAKKVGGAFTQPVPKADVLLHCGDLTMTGGLSAYKGVIKMLSQIDAELKLVIAGNHDLSLDKPYWDAKYCSLDDADEGDLVEHDKATVVMKGPLAKEAGITYLEEGMHTFTLKNGAKFTIYTSPYQPEFCGWAFPYERDQDRFNLPEHVKEGHTSIAKNPVPDFPNVDIMMTHGPPKDILDWTDRGPTVGCENLLRAVSRARPRLYCFGHIHEGHGADMVTWKDDKTLIGQEAIEKEKMNKNVYPTANKVLVEFGKQTLMINAAIMNVRYKPVNAPWLVELELPKAV